MHPDFYEYPAFFYYDEDGISIEFPDLPGCLSCANDSEEAFRSAREALGLHLFGMEEDGDVIPPPSRVQDLRPDEGGAIVMIQAYMPYIRESARPKFVKKTLTIPSWLNAAALENHVNFSQVLQSALIAQLGVQPPHTPQHP